MAKKSALGRGLSAILEDVEEAYKKDILPDNQEVRELPLSKIDPNPYQPRKNFDDEALVELSNSILTHGLLQPIIVVNVDDRYVIVAGERRYRASKLAGLETIKAIVADIEMEKFRELALIENIQREELNPIELAKSYRELIDQYGITQERLGEILHKSRTLITNTLRLLNLSEYVQDLVSSSKLSQGHAKVLVGLDEKSQKMIADTIIGQKLTVRDTEDLIKKLKSKAGTKVTKRNIKESIDKSKLQKVTKSLETLGFKSKISSSKVVINFSQESDIERFLKLLESQK